MNQDYVIRAIRLHPEVLPYLDWETKLAYYKAAPISRDELEKRVARLVLAVDRGYLAALEAGGGRVSFDFWQKYEADLRAEIASPLRGYIEQSFSNYSDYVNFIDKSGAVGDIDTAMTQAISNAARGISQSTQAQLQALVSQGLSTDEIIESIALRFSSGHAEQVAITEITRAEAQFGEALSARLGEQGVGTQIRWLTSEDEKVCPICAPMDKKLKDEPISPGGRTSLGRTISISSGWHGQSWGERFGSPPAHPNCRCQTVVELSK
jgi:hypothetical protein